MNRLVAALRPQILAAIVALTIIAVMLVVTGNLEGAVGVAGIIGVIAERILQSQDTPTVNVQDEAAEGE